MTAPADSSIPTEVLRYLQYCEFIKKEYKNKVFYILQ